MNKLVFAAGVAAGALTCASAAAAQDRVAAGLNAVAAIANAFRPTVVVPVPTVPAGQALSPGEVARLLQNRGFRVTELQRKGPAYQAEAVGPHGNDVELLVDGRSGHILGMDVVRWAPAVARVAPVEGGVFLDDIHPFGIVVPDSRRVGWETYGPAQWTTMTAPTIVAPVTYEPYALAVPSQYVRTNGAHRSFSAVPHNYGGLHLTDPSGHQLHAAENRAERAEERAALAADREQRAQEAKEATNAENQDLKKDLIQTVEERDAANAANDKLNGENRDLVTEKDAAIDNAEKADKDKAAALAQVEDVNNEKNAAVTEGDKLFQQNQELAKKNAELTAASGSPAAANNDANSKPADQNANPAQVAAAPAADQPADPAQVAAAPAADQPADPAQVAAAPAADQPAAPTQVATAPAAPEPSNVPDTFTSQPAAEAAPAVDADNGGGGNNSSGNDGGGNDNGGGDSGGGDSGGGGSDDPG